MKGFDEPSSTARPGCWTVMQFAWITASPRFFSALRGRTRANRRQHSVIPFVLALNEIVRISRIVCSIVIAGSPRIHYLRTFFLLPCTRHPLFFLFYYIVAAPRSMWIRLQGIFTIEWIKNESMPRMKITSSLLFFPFLRDESSSSVLRTER